MLNYSMRKKEIFSQRGHWDPCAFHITFRILQCHYISDIQKMRNFRYLYILLFCLNYFIKRLFGWYVL